MSTKGKHTSFFEFFSKESSGGIILAMAAIAALIVSNSSYGDLYQAFLSIPGQVIVGDDGLVLSKPLIVWVNDLWMAAFFFLVGLEIKREFLAGELSGPGQLTLPALSALGGMAVPALIYVALNQGDAAALQGWAIPAATDIAFALGIVVLLGSKVPLSLKVFLTAVAIIDDLLAIVIIALFYTSSLSITMLLGAFGAGLVLFVLNRLKITRVDVYIVVGIVMWLFVLKSGVHATLAGVATALAIPMRDSRGNSPLETVEHGLHPWVAFLVLPVFAFSNAGVVLAGVTLDTLLAPIPLGIILGLFVGKTIGVFGVSYLLIRLGWVKAPAGANTMQLLGVSILCGIGFTMSLFVGGLAFVGLDPSYTLQLKIGVLGGSLVSGIVGTTLLLLAAKRKKIT
jgi:Na+:H+ antiporter, NhaA family